MFIGKDFPDPVVGKSFLDWSFHRLLLLFWTKSTEKNDKLDIIKTKTFLPQKTPVSNLKDK